MIKRPDKYTAYILGNGASIGADRYPVHENEYMPKIPSANNFFKDTFYFETEKEGVPDFLNLLDQLHEIVNTLIVQAWRIDAEVQFWDKDAWDGVNIEDVFSFFDIGEKMYSHNTRYHKVFVQAKKELRKFIGFIILSKTAGQSCLYLEKLFSNIDDKDLIITFNWDTIIDVTLEHINNTHYKMYRELFNEDHLSLRDFYNKGKYLKLHGSVNWAYCYNRDCIVNRKLQLLTGKDGTLQSYSLSESDRCPICGKRIAMVIVPPTSNKITIHRDSFIHKQWLAVREGLRYCGKLVFIGYSFPPADSHAEWLFRQINFLINTDKSFVEKEIVVVNPAYSDKSSMEYIRYNQIFRTHRINHYNNLAEYLEVRNA